MYLGAYGKHPGWNDHIDDIGLETERLVAIKRVLYVEGIGAAIDSGAWDKLDESQRIEGFDHLLLWRAPGEIILCRLWSSTDGKGRTKYPMVVSAHCRATGLPWALQEVLPRLEEARRRCAATTSAAEVRSTLDSLRGVLRSSAASLSGAQPETASPRVLAQLADRPEMGAGAQGLHRILYQIEREMADYAPAGSQSPTASSGGSSRTRLGDLRPQHIRVPACAETPGAVMALWAQFLLCHFDPGAAMAIIVPVGRDWADLIVGELDGTQSFCIRASPKSVPLATEIPYNLDPAFVARCDQRIQEARSGAAEQVTVAPAGRKGAGGVLSSLASMFGGRKKTYLLLIAAGAVALIAAGVAIYLTGPGSPAQAGVTKPRTQPSPVVIRPPPQPGPAGGRVTGEAKPVQPGAAPANDDWQKLCTDYRTWFGLFLKRLDERPRIDLPGGPFDSRRAVYAADANLAAILAQLPSGAGDPAAEGGDPWSIAGVGRGRDLEQLARSPTDAVRTESGAQKIAAALSRVRAVSDGLSASSWQLLGSIAGAAEALQSVGRGPESALARHIVANVAPGKTGDLAASIDAALVAGPVFQRIADNLKTLDRASGTLGDTRDPLLLAFGPWAATQLTLQRASPGPASGAAQRAEMPALLEFDRRLDEVARLAFRLSAFVAEKWQATDHQLMVARSPVYASASLPGAEVFESWLREAASYPLLDAASDPRRSSPVRGVLAEVAANIDTLTGTLNVDADAGAPQRHADLVARLEQLDRLAWNSSTRRDIETGLAELQTQAAALRQTLANQLAQEQGKRAGSAREVRQGLSSTDSIVARSDAVNAAWRAARDRLLANIPDEQYVQLRLKAQELQQALTAFNSAVPPGLETSGQTAPWAGVIATESWARREQLIKDALAGWQTGPQTPDPAALAGAQGAIAADFGSWLSSAQSLIADTWAIQRMLDAGFDLREQENAATVESLYQSASHTGALKSPAVAGAVAPIFERVEALRAMESRQDPAALLAQLNSAKPDRVEIAVAAWRRLGQLPSWPATARQLGEARQADESILRTVVSLEHDRRAQVEAVVASDKPRRWQKCFAALSTPAEIESAAAQAGVFAVDPAVLPAPLRYNLFLADLKRQAGVESLTDPQVTELVRAFVRDARALEDVPAAKSLLQNLDGLTGERPRPAVDAATLGPGSVAGWSGAWQGKVLRFSRTSARGQAITLDFVRVDAATPEESFYLGATEVPVGAFIEVIDAAGEWDQLVAMFPQVSPVDDYREGPRTWRWTADARRKPVMRLAASWLTEVARGRSVPESPAELNVGRPALLHPVQFIPPDAAVLMATLVGCRLPTSTEWSSAYASIKPTIDPKTCNLRDQSWAQQQRYCVNLSRGGTVQWPDASIAIPHQMQVPRAEFATANDWSDGALWFLPVDSDAADRAIHHLVGNVAEYVLDAAPSTELQANSGSIKTFLRRNREALKVIGGSAISPKEVDIASAFAIDLDEATEGFADVGIRLAFSTSGVTPRPEPLSAKLSKLLSEAAYLAAH